jgi:hypothetical protein
MEELLGGTRLHAPFNLHCISSSVFVTVKQDVITGVTCHSGDAQKALCKGPSAVLMGQLLQLSMFLPCQAFPKVS